MKAPVSGKTSLFLSHLYNTVFQLPFKTRLLLHWLVLLAIIVAMAALLASLAREGSRAQLARAELAARSGCESLLGLAARHGQPAALEALADLALRDLPGVEGGYWEGRLLVHVFPTQGDERAPADAPPAELPHVSVLAQRAQIGRTSLVEIDPGLRETRIAVACAGTTGPAAWTQAHVPTLVGSTFDRLALAMAALLVFTLLAGGGFLWTVTRWNRSIGAIEAALRREPDGAQPLADAPTGHPELDRIARAINAYAERLAAARDEAAALGRTLADTQRLALLGRLSAGLAHEVRNPLATLRLRAENALAAAGDDATRLDRARQALDAVLEQAGRVERLIGSLLALTQPFHPIPRDADPAAWLDACAARHQAAFAARGVTLAVAPPDDAPAARFDPELMGRACDNLLANALAHTPEGGTVTLSLRRHDDRLVVRVADSGPGVAPRVAAQLFEPFVTGRAGGVGLGLALVREIAAAHGGSARLVPDTPGATFEIAWPARPA